MSHGIVVNPRVGAAAAGVAELEGLASSVISDVTGRQVGTVGLRPVNRSPVSVCGNALTVKVRAGDNLLIYKALDMLQPGDVLVVDGEGDITRALAGEILMRFARSRGAVGFVIDGAVRDVEAFEEHRFPCWSRGVSLRGPFKDGPGAVNVPIAVGGMVVHPGDVIVGDSDGVVAVPAAEALQVAHLAREKADAERAMMAEIADGTFSIAWVDAALKHKGL